MLSIENSSHAEWRGPFQATLPSGHDIDNESEVRQVFADGLKWADEEGVPHKRDSSDHYADQYLRTQGSGSPIIPRFMRAYCAHMHGLTCACDSQRAQRIGQAQHTRRRAATRSRVSREPAPHRNPGRALARQIPSPVPA